MLGSVLGGKFRILSPIGRGGMGVVYEARHVGTGRRVAVKVLDSRGSPALAMRRFEQEARAIGALDSRHIPRVIDVAISDTDAPYIVMDFLEGDGVDALRRAYRRLPVSLVVAIAAQACLGLDAAHARGIVHRDVKAANLFVAREDGARVVKVLDFGVAKLKATDLGVDAGPLTLTGSLVGSPHYLSPEQALGSKDVDPRSDVWALGVVMYELLCGETPFAQVKALGELIVRICGVPAQRIEERVPGVPPEVAAIVHKALALKREVRFESALAMREALLAFQADDRITEQALEAAADAAARELAPDEAAGAASEESSGSVTVSLGATAAAISAEPPAVAPTTIVDAPPVRRTWRVALASGAAVVAAALAVMVGAARSSLVARGAPPSSTVAAASAPPEAASLAAAAAEKATATIPAPTGAAKASASATPAGAESSVRRARTRKHPPSDGREAL